MAGGVWLGHLGDMVCLQSKLMSQKKCFEDLHVPASHLWSLPLLRILPLVSGAPSCQLSAYSIVMACVHAIRHNSLCSQATGNCSVSLSCFTELSLHITW